MEIKKILLSRSTFQYFGLKRRKLGVESFLEKIISSLQKFSKQTNTLAEPNFDFDLYHENFQLNTQ